MTTPRIKLDPMTDEEYDAWLEPGIEHYAQETVEAGSASAENAVESARADFHRLLPLAADGG